jgi:hypothetical protein
MRASTATDVERLLRSLLASGYLRSQYDRYVNTEIRTGSRTFYTRIAEELGSDAAESALRDWNAVHRLSDYANVIEPVARGMLAMAAINTQKKYVSVLDNNPRTKIFNYSMPGPSRIVLVNAPAPGCGCTQPPNWEIFGPDGRLGLKAVVLYFNHNDPGATGLGIILPARNTQASAVGRCGFTVAQITSSGRTDTATFLPQAPDEHFLMKLLGQHPGYPRVGCSFFGGHFDDGVGFPGATDYLANHLPKLEAYLTELARKLSGGHRH